MRAIKVTKKVQRARLPAIFAALAGLLIGCGGKGDPTPAAQSVPDHNAPTGGSTTGAVPTARSPVPKTPVTGPGGSDVKMNVEITKGVLSINGSRLDLPAELSAVEKAFGKPSHTSEKGVFRAIYWKDLGIKCLQQPYGDKMVVTVQFCFYGYYDPDNNKGSKPFSGTLLLERQPVTKDTELPELSKKIDSLKKVREDNWEVKVGGSATVYLKGLTRGTDEVAVEKLSK